jgi:hypothetical protein
MSNYQLSPAQVNKIDTVASVLRLVAPAMALAVIGLMFLSKWLFKGDVKWISDENEKSLRDPRSA